MTCTVTSVSGARPGYRLELPEFFEEVTSIARQEDASQPVGAELHQTTGTQVLLAFALLTARAGEFGSGR